MENSSAKVFSSLPRTRKLRIRDRDTLLFVLLSVARGKQERAHCQNGEEHKCQTSLHFYLSLKGYFYK